MTIRFRKRSPLNNILKKSIRPNVYIIVFLGMIFFSFSVFYGQQTDPFYNKLLRDGERSLLARNYNEAVKELEIAAFGLHREKKLLGKAYVYLGLCYYYLIDNEKSKEYLNKALPILKEEGIESMEIHPSTKRDLGRILDLFILRIGEKKEELNRVPDKYEIAKPVLDTKEKKLQKESPPLHSEFRSPPKKSSQLTARELEKRIKAEPHNIPLYYELYNLYRKERNVKTAKKLLETLVEKNPNELGAYYLLAKIEFSQKDYQNALGYFNKVIKPTEESQVSNELLLKSMIHISICLYRLNQRQHLESFVALVEESSADEQLLKMLKEEGLERDWREIKRVLK